MKSANPNGVVAFKVPPGSSEGVSDKPQGGVGQATLWGRFRICLAFRRRFRHQSWSCFAQAVESATPHRVMAFKGPAGSSDNGPPGSSEGVSDKRKGGV